MTVLEVSPGEISDEHEEGEISDDDDDDRNTKERIDRSYSACISGTQLSTTNLVLNGDSRNSFRGAAAASGAGILGTPGENTWRNQNSYNFSRGMPENRLPKYVPAKLQSSRPYNEGNNKPVISRAPSLLPNLEITLNNSALNSNIFLSKPSPEEKLRLAVLLLDDVTTDKARKSINSVCSQLHDALVIIQELQGQGNQSAPSLVAQILDKIRVVYTVYNETAVKDTQPIESMTKLASLCSKNLFTLNQLQELKSLSQLPIQQPQTSQTIANGSAVSAAAYAPWGADEPSKELSYSNYASTSSFAIDDLPSPTPSAEDEAARYNKQALPIGSHKVTDAVSISVKPQSVANDNSAMKNRDPRRPVGISAPDANQLANPIKRPGDSLQNNTLPKKQRLDSLPQFATSGSGGWLDADEIPQANAVTPNIAITPRMAGSLQARTPSQNIPSTPKIAVSSQAFQNAASTLKTAVSSQPNTTSQIFAATPKMAVSSQASAGLQNFTTLPKISQVSTAKIPVNSQATGAYQNVASTPKTAVSSHATTAYQIIASSPKIAISTKVAASSQATTAYQNIASTPKIAVSSQASTAYQNIASTPKIAVSSQASSTAYQNIASTPKIAVSSQDSSTAYQNIASTPKIAVSSQASSVLQNNSNIGSQALIPVQNDPRKTSAKPRDPRLLNNNHSMSNKNALQVQNKTQASAVFPVLMPASISPQLMENLRNLVGMVGKNNSALQILQPVPPVSTTDSPPKTNVSDLTSIEAEEIHPELQQVLDGLDEEERVAFVQERQRRMNELHQMIVSRKLCLVLDLDHTLLNSAKFMEIESESEQQLRANEAVERSRDGSARRELYRFPGMSMWTKLRPGIWKFLARASQLYELHLYTMGNKAYATEMAKLLDPSGVLFSGRVISKGDEADSVEGDPKSKDLDGVLGMESAVVIIDDSARVWPHHRENLIVVERYMYFPSSRRQFGLAGPSLLEMGHDERESDGMLASTLAMIEAIHSSFFLVQQQLRNADVREVMAMEQRKILAGCKIIFSRVFPVGEAQPQSHPLWRMAQQFGAICTTQIEDDVTHVVAISLGTDKVNWAISTGRFLVRPQWLEASTILYRRANERDFPVPP